MDSKLIQKWVENGLKINPKWSKKKENEHEMRLNWIKNGSKRTQNELKKV